ncbi:hypothetical protein R3P38DRAFT_1330351 [Favolaschia claudopus]|uniref:Uncharacterized protein n=1 Tax=Favolaschia claudopus TaxID=2862362 RepID=A0AAW0AUQ5_9AGAR
MPVPLPCLSPSRPRLRIDCLTNQPSSRRISLALLALNLRYAKRPFILLDTIVNRQQRSLEPLLPLPFLGYLESSSQLKIFKANQAALEGSIAVVGVRLTVVIISSPSTTPYTIPTAKLHSQCSSVGHATLNTKTSCLRETPPSYLFRSRANASRSPGSLVLHRCSVISHPTPFLPRLAMPSYATFKRRALPLRPACCHPSHPNRRLQYPRRPQRPTYIRRVLIHPQTSDSTLTILSPSPQSLSTLAREDSLSCPVTYTPSLFELHTHPRHRLLRPLLYFPDMLPLARSRPLSSFSAPNSSHTSVQYRTSLPCPAAIVTHLSRPPLDSFPVDNAPLQFSFLIAIRSTSLTLSYPHPYIIGVTIIGVPLTSYPNPLTVAFMYLPVTVFCFFSVTTDPLFASSSSTCTAPALVVRQICCHLHSRCFDRSPHTTPAPPQAYSR